MASTGEGSGANEPEGERLDQMPGALLCTIMSKLDVGSICSIASTCTAFRASASHLFGFIPNFHLLEIALSIDLLGPLLPPNPYLRSLKLDCERLDDSAISFVAQPTLQELCVHNCTDFSGKLLSEIGGKCPDLRCLYLGSVAEKRGRAIHISDLEELLSGCRQLEALVLMFDVSLFLRHNFTRVWALASEKLESLEIGYVSSVMVTELLSSNVASQAPNSVQPSILPNIQKLDLSVDYITDTMVGTISSGLVHLTHLDLRDAPLMEPTLTFDLTNSGLQLINQYGKLKHLSLIRSQEYLITYFRRVNDLGLLLMADNCANMESICLGGFCRVTDTGFKTILHSCSRLCKLKVCHGTHLTDLVFHDISATALSLTHVSLRWCYLLTNHAIANLVSNTQLKVLDLRECKSLGDQALKAIGKLSELKILKLDGSDVSDSGLSFLRPKVIQSLMSLSVRGCKRLTDKCISSLFEGTSNLELQELDLSNIPNLTDEGILSLARSRVPVSELRLRQCPLIGDTSVMALASMQVNEDQRHGNCLRLLDLYNCGGITQLAFRWLKNPYFPRLRWLGIAGSMNRDIVDALARNRRFLHVALHGEEIGPEQWDNIDGVYMHEYDDMDELEEWLIGGGEFDDIDMVDAENAADLLA
ncbi:F-box/LRR-repeat protein 10 [Linum perenne]